LTQVAPWPQEEIEMNSLVIYGSRYGNTEKVAAAIAAELGQHGEVRMVSSEDAPAIVAEKIDLVVVGGPTEAHRMTEPMAQLFDRVGEGWLAGKAAAAFDTRVRWPLFLSGSAAAGIVRKLEAAGAAVISPPMSFFVGGTPTVLEQGELAQATAWAASLPSKLESKKPVLAAR
jgi:flavodoxin